MAIRHYDLIAQSAVQVHSSGRGQHGQNHGRLFMVSPDHSVMLDGVFAGPLLSDDQGDIVTVSGGATGFI